MSNKGFILWFTGLSGSGKSTLASYLTPILRERGTPVEVLDGDEVRENLSKGLGFSKEDRDTNIARIGYVANMLARNGVVAMTAAISPYAELRQTVRSRAQAPFIEVYLKCALEVVEERDTKGLYKKARAGQLKNFTGIDSDYEPPEQAEIILKSAQHEADILADQIIRELALDR